MALFAGEDLVDVQAPDGRTLRLPASVAASLALSRGGGMGAGGMQGGQLPPPPPPPPQNLGPSMPPPADQETAPAPVMPQSVTGGKLPLENSLENAPQPAPPADVPAPVTPVALTAANTDNTPPPAPKPVTTKQLQTEGVAGGINRINDALGNVADAGREKAEADIAQQKALEIATGEHLNRFDAIQAQAKAEADKNLRDRATKEGQASTIRDKIANYKIDRSSDHPIVNAIGIALAGLGQAMASRFHGGQIGENPAMVAFYKAIDRKVAGQMGDLDKLRADYGMKRDEIADLRTNFSDQRAMRDTLTAAEIERSKIVVQKVMAQTNSDVVRANAQQILADLQMKGAEAYAGGIDKQTAVDQAKAKLKQEEDASKRAAYVALQGQKTQKEIAGAELQYKYAALDDAKNQALAQAKASGNAAQVKAMTEAEHYNEERGLGNAALGGYVLKKRGLDKIAQAEDFDQQAAAAAKSGNAAAADLLKQKAQDLRADARTNDVFHLEGAAQKADFVKGYGATQNVLQIKDDIKRMVAQHGKDWVTTDEGRAAIQEKATTLMMTLKDAEHLGVLSKIDAGYLSQQMGGQDPAKMTPEQMAFKFTDGLIGKSPDAFAAQLDGLAVDTKRKIYAELQGKGYDGQLDDLFAEEKASKVGAANAAFRSDKTPTEQSAAGQVNPAIGAAQKVFYGTTSAEVGKQTENSGSFKYDLTTGQEKALTTVVNAVRAGSAKGAKKDAIEEGQRARESLTALVSDPNVSDRQKLSALHLLRDQAPDLYEAAKAKATGELADQLDRESLNRANIETQTAPINSKRGPVPIPTFKQAEQARLAVIGSMGTFDLAKGAINDPELFSELSKRAANDPQAKKALSSVIETRSKLGVK